MHSWVIAIDNDKIYPAWSHPCCLLHKCLLTFGVQQVWCVDQVHISVYWPLECNRYGVLIRFTQLSQTNQILPRQFSVQHRPIESIIWFAVRSSVLGICTSNENILTRTCGKQEFMLSVPCSSAVLHSDLVLYIQYIYVHSTYSAYIKYDKFVCVL